MPIEVPLQAIPNQSFSISLDNNTFGITLIYADSIMAVSMTINGVDTIDNIRCVAGSPLIPSRYEEAGNFLFLTQNFALPIYEQFGSTQSLLYFTAAELATYRAAKSPPITAASFNPIAGLPLRFSPQGYQ